MASKQDGVEITVLLDERTAWALAQFVKRTCWEDFRRCAVDDAEACDISAGVDRVMIALGQAGYRPR